jgi:hypothetical protein
MCLSNMQQKIESHSFIVGLFVGFALTLSVSGYIIGTSMIPKFVLYQKEYYMDGIRFTIKRN